MSAGTAPPAKRRRLEHNRPLQQPQQTYERTTANGNSRNVYGNIYNGPVSYTGVPAEGTESDDKQTAERLLEALNFDEREDRLATIGKAHEETCQWLFEKNEYKAWRDPEKRHIHHGFFWIKGKPGTGKSTLMKCAYNRGLKEFTGDVILSFFFNARGVKLQKSTEGMYRSLLCQLLERIPTLAAKLPHRECQRLQKPGWPIELLKDVLREALLLVDAARITCYVDALDECQEQDAREMIDFFEILGSSAVASDASVHVLLSSRHYPEIHISKCQQLILEKQYDHGSDIVKYMESKLQIGSSVTSCAIKSTLLRKASGVFLWVVLVVQILNEHKRRGLVHELKQRVDDIPKGLDKLFAEILQEGSSEVPYTFPMLRLIAFASRPLMREEVYHAVLHSDAQHDTTSLIDITEDDMEHFIVNCSKGLAEMSKGVCPTVQLIHESVRNHLLYTEFKTAVPASCDSLLAWCHEDLKDLCLGYVKNCAAVLLQLPIDGQKEHLSDHFMEIIELKRQTNTKHPFLDYALNGVFTHAQQAHCAGRLQHAYLRTFPLDTWIRLHNMLASSHNIRLSRCARLVYILVTRGAFQLAELIIEDASWRPETENSASHERHCTLLGAATDRGDYQMLDKLLTVGVPPNSDAKDGKSCLSLAIGYGHVRMSRRLIAAGAKVTNMNTTRGPSDLRLAVESGCLEIVQALLQHPQYAHHSNSSFEADLKYSIRRYSMNIGGYEDLVPLIDEALRRSGESDPRILSTKDDTRKLYTAILRAACQRTDIPVVHWTIDQGAIVNADVLETSFIVGNLSVIDLLLEVRTDIKPSSPRASSNVGREDSKLVQLLLDQAENAIDAVLEAVYPHFSKASPVNDSRATLPAAMYPAPTSRHANARDIRFGKCLPLAVYHSTWVSLLKRLLDKSLHVSNREDYMDTALQCACYREHQETLQLLLDWCQDSPLKYRSLPGLGQGLVYVVRGLFLGRTMMQYILDSKLDISVDKFCEAFQKVLNCSHSFENRYCLAFLGWGVERSRRDEVFANELEFVPTGDDDDQHRLIEHLRSRRSLHLRPARARDEMM
jgi:hypothetical protein